VFYQTQNAFIQQPGMSTDPPLKPHRNQTDWQVPPRPDHDHNQDDELPPRPKCDEGGDRAYNMFLCYLCCFHVLVVFLVNRVGFAVVFLVSVNVAVVYEDYSSDLRIF
jgi:hypothetical protein